MKINIINGKYIVGSSKFNKLEFIRFIENDMMAQLLQKENSELEYKSPENSESIVSEYTNSYIPYGFNRIIYGAPGTGKSHRLKEQVKECGLICERVTFHPDYSYSNFVGAYKPVMEKSKEFIDVLKDVKNPENLTESEINNLCITLKEDNDNGLNTLLFLLSLKFPDIDIYSVLIDKLGDQIELTDSINQIQTIIKADKYIYKNNETNIKYEFVPGPFIRQLIKAKKSILNNDNKKYVLIIEEINRANVSSVFGDVFQLLDRDASGKSEYKIQVSEELRLYLLENGILDEEDALTIPENLYIWATMNSADQGVFHMDTAFKRRWSFEYIDIDENDSDIEKFNFNIGGKKVNWNNLRKSINDCLSSEVIRVNEDKLIGPYFISPKDFEIDGKFDENKFLVILKNKLLMYLLEDVIKHRKKDFFAKDINTNRFSLLSKEFDEKGVYIFCDMITDKLNFKL